MKILRSLFDANLQLICPSGKYYMLELQCTTWYKDNLNFVSLHDISGCWNELQRDGMNIMDTYYQQSKEFTRDRSLANSHLHDQTAEKLAHKKVDDLGGDDDEKPLQEWWLSNATHFKHKYPIERDELSDLY